MCKTQRNELKRPRDLLSAIKNRRSLTQLFGLVWNSKSDLKRLDCNFELGVKVPTTRMTGCYTNLANSITINTHTHPGDITHCS